MANIITLFVNLMLMVFIISPLLFLVIFPLYLYRLLIIFFSKIFRRDLLQIVPARDALFANDECNIKPSSTVVVLLKFDGDVDLKSIRMWTRKLFEDNNEKNRLSKYKKYFPLQQYHVPWGGFMFRKWEEDFKIDNHVREWHKNVNDKNDPNSRVSQDDLFELRKSLLLEPYKSGSSPWELILVRNCEYGTAEESVGFAGIEKIRSVRSVESKTVAILMAKLHHGVGDGFSLISMLLTCFTDDTSSPLEYKEPLTWIQNLKLFGATYIMAPSNAISQLPKVHQDNIFHPNNARLKGTRNPVDDTVPVPLVKDVAKQTGTAFTAVVLAALAGGIRSYLESIQKPVPDIIDVTIPLPWPGHPDRVGNHFTFAVIELPVGTPTAIKRLKDLQKKFLELKRSTVPAFNYLNGSIAGSLPVRLLNSILEGGPSSILLSNLPGPSEKFAIFGKPLLQPFYEGGYGKAPLGMGVTMFSYNGVLTISINPDEGIIPTKVQALQLLKSIVDEFNVLNQDFIV